MNIDLCLSCICRQQQGCLYLNVLSTTEEVESLNSWHSIQSNGKIWGEIGAAFTKKGRTFACGSLKSPINSCFVSVGNANSISHFSPCRKASALPLFLNLSHWNGSTWNFPWYSICFRMIFFEVSARTVPLPRKNEKRHLFVQVKKEINNLTTVPLKNCNAFA